MNHGDVTWRLRPMTIGVCPVTGERNYNRRIQRSISVADVFEMSKFGSCLKRETDALGARCAPVKLLRKRSIYHVGYLAKGFVMPPDSSAWAAYATITVIESSEIQGAAEKYSRGLREKIASSHRIQG